MDESNLSMVSCFRCGRTISLRFIKRHGYCSYCGLALAAAPVWFRFSTGWHPGEVKALGRARGLDTMVTISDVHNRKRREARRGWREIRFRDPELKEQDKPNKDGLRQDVQPDPRQLALFATNPRN